MKFSRQDYNGRIVDLENKIPEDEPCFLLRGSDALAPALLLRWAMELRLQGGDVYTATCAESHAQDMLAWQQLHGSRVPDAKIMSDVQEYYFEIIKSIIKTISSDSPIDFELSKLRKAIKEVYGSDEYLGILMPYDAIHTPVTSLTDFSEDAVDSVAKCKLVIFMNGRTPKLIINKIWQP